MAKLKAWLSSLDKATAIAGMAMLLLVCLLAIYVPLLLIGIVLGCIICETKNALTSAMSSLIDLDGLLIDDDDDDDASTTTPKA